MIDSYVVLVKEARLLVVDSQFAVNRCQNALHLSESEHTAK